MQKINPPTIGWKKALAVYGDKRVLAMLFLGFSSGLPFGVLAEPLTAWLAEQGLSKTAIGLFALVSIPYSFKFVWAPLMDRLPLPILTKLLGRRRGWVLLTQVLLLVSILLLSQTNPVAAPFLTGLFGMAVAFSSASQDIVIDAYRVEILEEQKLAAGAATATFGWRLGQVGSGAAGLILADMLPWPAVFTLMACFVLVGMVAILLNPEPAALDNAAAEAGAIDPQNRLTRIRAWVFSAVISPFADFMQRPGWLAIVLFILLYKFGDAVLSVMKIPFFLDIGFTKTEIAEVAKLFGFNAIIAGGFLGGIVMARLGIMRGLMLCGILMAVSNLVFILQAQAGHDLKVLAFSIAVENIATGMGTTAFVAYLSSLCHQAYTATQYALLSSLMAFSRTVMSSGAGWLADQMDWTSFFVVTTFAALPGLFVLWWITKRYTDVSESR